MVDTLFKTEAINEEEKYCVYCHRNKINGKRYIGQTKHQDNLVIRTGSDGRGYFHNKYFKRAIQKYGWDNFEHYIIQGNLTKEEADELEKLNILAYNTTNSNFGYNIDKGGSHGGSPATEHQKEVARQTFTGREPWNKGKTLSEEHKAKCSASLKGKNTWSKGRKLSKEHIEAIKRANTNKIVSEETRKKLSIASKGRKLSDKAKQKISKANKGRKWTKEQTEKRKQLYDDKEFRQKLSESHKGQKAWNKGIACSNKCKSKISSANTGRITINNKVITKRVKKEELDKYLLDGWVLGYAKK